MNDPWHINGAGRAPEPSRRAKQLLHEVNSRIALMEVVLGNLHRMEAASGVERETDRAHLRTKLTACYIVRKELERGLHEEAGTLTELLRRAEIRLEHKKFDALGAVQRDELSGIDYDDLSRRFFD